MLFSLRLENGRLTISDGSVVNSIDRLKSMLCGLIDGSIKYSTFQVNKNSSQTNHPVYQLEILICAFTFEYLETHLDYVVKAVKKLRNEINLPEITSPDSVRQLFNLRKTELETYTSAHKKLEAISYFFNTADQSGMKKSFFDIIFENSRSIFTNFFSSSNGTD